MSDGPLISKSILTRQLNRQNTTTTSQADSNLTSVNAVSSEISQLEQPLEQNTNNQIASQIHNTSNLDELALDSQNVINNGYLDQNKMMSLAAIERQAITRTIDLCEGNIVKAASELEVSPSTLYRKIQQWQDLPSE
jgi:DNA-binding NtrC family response regulator